MKTSQNERIGVIGGGLGGLAAACTLAARGYQVILFERNEWLGGKAAVVEGAGFRFDTGPTIVTIPSVLRRIFAEAGRRMEDYLELVRLDPQWRCFFEDGSVLNLNQDPDTMAQTLDRFAPGTNSGRGYRDFIDVEPAAQSTSRSATSSTNPSADCATCSISKPSFDPKLLGDVLAMRMGRSVAGTVRAFNPDPRVAQMMDHFTQYVGSSPYGSPAVLCGIAHMQTDEGVWYPMGGTRAVPRGVGKTRARTRRRIPHRAPESKRSSRKAARLPAFARITARKSPSGPSSPTAIRFARTANSSTAASARSSRSAANTNPRVPASCCIWV